MQVQVETTPCSCESSVRRCPQKYCNSQQELKKWKQGHPHYPIFEALFEYLENKWREEGFFTEYDIVDQITNLEPMQGVDYISVVQPLLELVVENVQPIDTDSAIVLGKATRLMSENLMKLAYNEEQQQKEGEVSRYFSEARLMQKISSDHFMHAGVLSIVGQES